MANDYFVFKRFTVRHDKCAMKVGTDGVLLGAWANGGERILDIGTGSGLIALFMAQRCPGARVTAIDIEPGACRQAIENVVNAGLSDRINVVETPLQDFDEGEYDAIVCNPPFYADTLASKNRQRTMARSAETLPFSVLFRRVADLLAANGEFSVVIPASCRSVFDTEAAFAGMYPVRVLAVKTVPSKPVSRYLLAYSKRPVHNVESQVVCLNDGEGQRSSWYAGLTKDFYLY